MIAEEVEGDVISLAELELMRCGVGAEAEGLDAEFAELGVEVAEGAALRCAAASAGNGVPMFTREAKARWLSGDSGAGIEEENDRRLRGDGVKRDLSAGCAIEMESGESAGAKMEAGTIVGWYWQ